MNPLRVVFANMRRSRAGVWAATTLISIAVAIGVAVTAQERALRQGSARSAEAFDLVVGARGSPTQLILTTVYLQSAALDLVPGSVLKRMGREEGAVWIAPIVFGDSYRGHPLVGTTRDLIISGGTRPLAEGRMFSTPREVVVGADVPLGLGARFEAAHGLATSHRTPENVHHGLPFVVVGGRRAMAHPGTAPS